jgi:hypothetical protein
MNDEGKEWNFNRVMKIFEGLQCVRTLSNLAVTPPVQGLPL